ncbi:MAG: AIR synthase family protein [Deltaproteobacteria bacterium]|nr:AIR synthase family protein [Deltaproteobacteria bacterium]
MNGLPVGKIDSKLLMRLIAAYTGRDDRVVVGSGIGEDAAVIDMGNHYLIAKTDPITNAAEEIGHYAVNINANDIAAMGGIPRWFLATVLLPEGSCAGDLDRIFSQIAKSCNELGIVYCGGHTEITTSVTSPVVIGQMLGEAAKENLKPTAGCLPGDDLIMTKQAAIEGTAIIAIEKEEELRSSGVPEEVLRRARGYLRNPGISVLADAAIVSSCREVHALHDPTEGGIATGIYEMAAASGTGIEVDVEKVTVSEETRILCQYCGVDPLGIFASGSLLIAAAPTASAGIVLQLQQAGIAAAIVGRFTDQTEGLRLRTKLGVVPLPVFQQDELSKIFG